MDTESVDSEPIPSTSKDIANSNETKSYEDYPKRTSNVTTEKVPKWFKPL